MRGYMLEDCRVCRGAGGDLGEYNEWESCEKCHGIGFTEESVLRAMGLLEAVAAGKARMKVKDEERERSRKEQRANVIFRRALKAISEVEPLTLEVKGVQTNKAGTTATVKVDLGGGLAKTKVLALRALHEIEEEA